MSAQGEEMKDRSGVLLDPVERDPGGVQVIQRVAHILRALRDEAEGLSLAQIAARVGLARSTVHRLVTALEAEKFVVAATPRGRYRIGPALTGLAFSVVRDFAWDVHPFLVKLAAATSETVDLAVLEHDQVIFIDHVAGRGRLRAVSAIGAVFPAHCTANGKALLAELPEDELTRLLPERLERLTPSTIVDRAQLLKELAEIQLSGVAFDREEHSVGICAVGTVIRGRDGRSAALTIPVPAQRFYGNEQQLIDELARGRKQIEKALAT